MYAHKVRSQCGRHMGYLPTWNLVDMLQMDGRAVGFTHHPGASATKKMLNGSASLTEGRYNCILAIEKHREHPREVEPGSPDTGAESERSLGALKPSTDPERPAGH